jgi:dipeptidyl aminopeptidase/acylaminoacyl peptidase
MPFARLALGLSVLMAGAASAGAPKENSKPAAVLARERLTLQHQTNIVWCVAFAPDGKTLASVGGVLASKGELIVWETATGKQKFRVEQPRGIRFVAFSPDGTTLVTSDYHATTATLRDATTGQVRWVAPNDVSASAVAFSPDGKTLAVGGQNGCTRIWDIATRQKRITLEGHVDWVLQLAFTPDGKFLVTCGRDRTARLWDLTTGKEIRTFAGHTDNVEALALSPDGRTLATTSWDKTIKLWEVATGGLRANLTRHTTPVLTVAFSMDGRVLATGSGDINGPEDPERGEVRLWDLAAGKELTKFPAHPRGVWSVAFSPDDQALATASLDQTAKLWSLSWPRRSVPAVNLAGRELEKLWADLAGDDAARGYRAVWALASVPRDALPFLKPRLSSQKTPAVDEKRIGRLIADLADDEFGTREKATEELKKIGTSAKPALSKALEKKSSEETRGRLQQLLDTINRRVLPPATVRLVRAVESLEAMGTADAQECLASIARQMEDSPLRQEARLSLARLSRRAARAAPNEPSPRR